MSRTRPVRVCRIGLQIAAIRQCKGVCLAEPASEHPAQVSGAEQCVTTYSRIPGNQYARICLSYLGSYISGLGVLIFVNGLIEAFMRKRQAANNAASPLPSAVGSACRAKYAIYPVHEKLWQASLSGPKSWVYCRL
jgi:hypothetical protein